MQNQKLVDKIKAIADRKGCTQGQLALSWVHHQGDDVFPIPGRPVTAKMMKHILVRVLFCVSFTQNAVREDTLDEVQCIMMGGIWSAAVCLAFTADARVHLAPVYFT